MTTSPTSPHAVEPESPVLIDIETTARLIGLGRDSTYALANAGKLPILRFGRRILVHRALLEKQLAALAAQVGE